jgi:hypothetical protein
MKFGQVENPGKIDFTISSDHPDTPKVLKQTLKSDAFEAYVGCAKWNKKDLKNFYPKGVKDELAYYSTQFNSIELNATFYRLFPPATFDKWYKTVPENFRFFSQTRTIDLTLPAVERRQRGRRTKRRKHVASA